MEFLIPDWLTDWISKFWIYIKAFFWWLVDSFYVPFRWLAEGIWSIVEIAIFSAFDGFLTVAEFIFNGIDFASLSFLDLFSDHVHPVVIWFIDQLGLVQGFGIIASALGVRLLLNLIPAAVTRI
jgi:hypothetical protein